jgi:hypothetical protein
MECVNTSTHGLSARSSTHSIRDRHDRSRFPAVTVPSSPAAVWVSWDRSPGTFRPCRATGGLPDISPKKHTRICLLFMAHPTSVNDFLPGLCSSQQVPTPYLYQAGIRPDAPLTGLTCSSPLQHGKNRTPGSPHRAWLKPDRGGSAPPSLQRADQVGANTPHTRGDSTHCPDAGTPDGAYLAQMGKGTVMMALAIGDLPLQHKETFFVICLYQLSNNFFNHSIEKPFTIPEGFLLGPCRLSSIVRHRFSLKIFQFIENTSKTTL